MRADRFADSGEVGVLNGKLGLAPAQKRYGEERRNDARTTKPGPEFTQGTPPGQRARRSSRDGFDFTRSRPGADSALSSPNPAGRDRRTSGQAVPYSPTDPPIRAVMRFPLLHSGLERVLNVVTVRAYSMLSLILLAVPRRLPSRRRRTALAFLAEADDRVRRPTDPGTPASPRTTHNRKRGLCQAAESAGVSGFPIVLLSPFCTAC